MEIVICGSMTAAKEMVAIEKTLREHGHNPVLPEFAHEYATMETLDGVHAESAKNKIKHDLIRNHYEKIKKSDGDRSSRRAYRK